MPAISGRGKLGQCEMVSDLLIGQGQGEEGSSGLGKRNVM